ncbi:MAG: phosphate ABC transporter substrate-binding protein PstS [Deltaproteobacteria bacterium]|nr:phosphate ABC transporter substrate-binding protein PstS [Deltaproteobacteria bacterium]
MKYALLLILFGIALIGQPLFAGEKINGAGASFPYPVYSAWAFYYQKDTGVQVNYQSIGSGGGVRQISNRTVDFGASDAPLLPKVLSKIKLLQFPAVIGGVVPVINIPGVKSDQLKLDSKQLAMIFMGKITNWNDPEIVKTNPGLTLPDDKITVVHRSDGSGTTSIFTTYLSQVSRDWAKEIGKGKSVKWPIGIGGKGNEGVANYVKRVKNSIGYVEFAYAKNNKLSVILLKNRDGSFAQASFETFKAAAAGAKWDSSKGYYLWLVNAPGKDSWPISGATFILLGKENLESNRKVVRFFEWAFNNGDKTAEKLVYVPLPKVLKDSIRSYWKSVNIL